jgi:DNA-binding XRE family transcriptional regulator
MEPVNFNYLLIAFGEELKHKRISLNVQQKVWAARLGVSPQYYSAVEKGKVDITFTMAQKICREFSIPWNL